MQNRTISTQHKKPWWEERMKDFDRLEIQPCKISDYRVHSTRMVLPSKPEHASLWIVRGYYRSDEVYNGIEHFAEFKTKEEAQILYNRLLRDYPHLTGGQSLTPRLCHMPS